MTTTTAIQNAFAALDPRRTNQVKLSALRAALPQISAADLEAGINALRRARTMTLEASDGRHERLSEADREAGIVEDGQILVYIAMLDC